MASSRGSLLLFSLLVSTCGSSGSFATSFAINAPQGTAFVFTQSGDDLTIANGGSISINSNAVRATNNTINNNIVRVFGSISTNTGSDDGINLFDDAEISISGSILTQGNNSEGITVVNGATIALTSGSSITTNGNNAEALFGTNNAIVTIANGATINTDGSNSDGMQFVDNANIVMNGSIVTNLGLGSEGIITRDDATIRMGSNGSITALSNTADGIFSRDDADIIVSGTVLSGRRGITTRDDSVVVLTSGGSLAPQISHGIFARDGTTIVNDGNISTIGNDARGIFVGDNNAQNTATITNTGSITTTGTNSDGILADDDAIIINAGLIRTTAANSDGIDADARAQITNTGSIFAGGIGVNLLGGGGSKSIVNSGRIETTTPITGTAATTGYAVRFRNNNADDALTLLAGSRIIGRMDMGNGGGNDMVILDRTGGDIAWRWTFEDYNPNGNDNLSVIGGPFVVEVTGDSLGNGTTVTVGDTSLQTSAGAVLADISASQNKLALDRITEAWALGDNGAAEYQTGWNAWARGYFSLKNRDGRSATAGDTANSQHVLTGFAAGIDRAFGQRSFFGAYASTTHTTFTYEGREQVLTTDTTTGGAYARLQAMNGLFADLAVAAGYVEGEAGGRLRANNLVAGGIEKFEGGETDGAYISPTMRVGSEIALGAVKLVPSATIGYAAQWREGYAETGETVQSMGRHVVETTSARLELAAVLQHNGVMARFHGGITAQKDISGSADFMLGSQTFDIETASGEAEFGSFAGFAFNWAMGDRWALNLDAEASLADIPEDLNDTIDLIGVNASAGLRLNF
ncbi:MAG: autotransporter domain-containing protein [Hyphomicrobiales bacterium]